MGTIVMAVALAMPHAAWRRLHHARLMRSQTALERATPSTPPAWPIRAQTGQGGRGGASAALSRAGAGTAGHSTERYVISPRRWGQPSCRLRNGRKRCCTRISGGDKAGCGATEIDARRPM